MEIKAYYNDKFQDEFLRLLVGNEVDFNYTLERSLNNNTYVYYNIKDKDDVIKLEIFNNENLYNNILYIDMEN